MTFLRACIATLGLALASGGAAAQADADQGWPPGERLISKYRAGKFAEVVAEAPAVLKAEPWNDELRLALANSLLWSGREWQSVEHFSKLLESRQAVAARLGMANGLAWTGRMDEALPHYQAVMDESAFWNLYRKAEKGEVPTFPIPSDAAQRNEAKLGMANALRWMGRADKAHPLYLQLRASHPTSDIGEEGEFFARRELRARTTFNMGYTQDNTPMQRAEPLVSHQWRNAAKNVIFAIEGTGGHDWDDRRDLDRRDVTFRMEALDFPLAPRASVTQQNDPERKTFGDLRLQVTGWPLYVSGGRVNWGKLAFTTDALNLGLTANRYGVNGNYQIALGEFRGFYNHFDISDDNRVDAADVRLAFREWRPLGKEIKPFVGVNWRTASRTVPEYWSPQNYGLGYVGLEGEWERRDWYFFALGQVGFKLAGEASTAWGASVIAKRWIGNDWSIGATAYALGGTRGENYRAEGVNLIVEKLW